MAGPFVIREQTFEGQHLREYPRALASSQEDVVRLHARSYTPQEVDNGSVSGDMTIIAFHANGFSKEVYEPFFEALYKCLKERQGLTAGSIWIADQASQGTSALLNDEKLANDPSWFDHSRDILAMTNAFRKHMIRPICAVGHSMGGTQAIAAAHIHPRLFEAIVMIDPSINISPSPSLKAMLKYTLRKPEKYASREEAEEQVRKTPFFKTWDRRALQRYLDTAFHTSPTATIPDDSVKPTTTKHAEAATLTRANTEHLGISDTISDASRALYPDVDPSAPLTGPIYNPGTRIAWSYLPTLRPSALFLLGEGSHMSRGKEATERTRITGTAPGGSGGSVAGRVKSSTVPGGHFAPMTNVEGTAKVTADWLGEEIRRYQQREKAVVEGWGDRNLAEKKKLEPTVEQALKNWDGQPWPKAGIVNGKSRL